MNVWSFTGNLGGDAEQRYTANNDPVVSFSVAIKSGYGQKESTVWAKCSLWGKRGEAIAQYLTKGTQVAVSGELSVREWEKDGVKRSSIEVRANDVTLLGKKATEDAPKKPAKAAAGERLQDMDSDIPFAPHQARTVA